MQMLEMNNPHGIPLYIQLSRVLF